MLSNPRPSRVGAHLRTNQTKETPAAIGSFLTGQGMMEPPPRSGNPPGRAFGGRTYTDRMTNSSAT